MAGPHCCQLFSKKDSFEECNEVLEGQNDKLTDVYGESLPVREMWGVGSLEISNWDYISRFRGYVWHGCVEHLNWLFVCLICPDDQKSNWEERKERKEKKQKPHPLCNESHAIGWVEMWQHFKHMLLPTLMKSCFLNLCLRSRLDGKREVDFCRNAMFCLSCVQAHM